jgi:hypothetical protein
LTLWRIHRRATDDADGHVFAFDCYAAQDVHEKIKRTITEHPAINFLRDTKLLRDSFPLEDDPADSSAIGAFSVKTWPGPLQEAWPYYIHGVSRMALELIEKLRPSPPPKLVEVSAFDGCKAYYVDLMGEFNAVWRNCGSDAFLHHINAVFGYCPVVAQPRQVDGMLRF